MVVGVGGVTWRHGESSGSGDVVWHYIIHVKSALQFLVFEGQQGLVHSRYLIRGRCWFCRDVKVL